MLDDIISYDTAVGSQLQDEHGLKLASTLLSHLQFCQCTPMGLDDMVCRFHGNDSASTVAFCGAAACCLHKNRRKSINTGLYFDIYWVSSIKWMVSSLVFPMEKYRGSSSWKHFFLLRVACVYFYLFFDYNLKINGCTFQHEDVVTLAPDKLGHKAFTCFRHVLKMFCPVVTFILNRLLHSRITGSIFCRTNLVLKTGSVFVCMFTGLYLEYLWWVEVEAEVGGVCTKCRSIVYLAVLNCCLKVLIKSYFIFYYNTVTSTLTLSGQSTCLRG